MSQTFQNNSNDINKTYNNHQKKEISNFNHNKNYDNEDLSNRMDSIELQIHNINNKKNKKNNKDYNKKNNEDIYYMEDNNCCNSDDISYYFKSTKNYSEDIITGEKCKGINVLCYMLGTFCGSIPLGFGLSIVIGMSTNNIYIPWIIIVSCIAAIIMSSCLFCIFKLIKKNSETDNYGGTFDVEDTCFSCCINIDNSDYGRDLNMFVYIICFLIIGIPLGIAFQFMTINNIHNYKIAGWIIIVSSVVWLIFLSLIIIMIKLLKDNQKE